MYPVGTYAGGTPTTGAVDAPPGVWQAPAAASDIAATDLSTVLAVAPVSQPPQGWVGAAAIATGAVLGAAALLKRGRAVSLARRQRHTTRSNRWTARGSDAR